jgi:hypothetical protein
MNIIKEKLTNNKDNYFDTTPRWESYNSLMNDNTLENGSKKKIMAFSVLIGSLFTNLLLFKVEILEELIIIISKNVKSFFQRFDKEVRTTHFGQDEEVKEEESKKSNDCGECDDYCNKRCVVEQNENGEWNADIIQKSELEPENEQMKKEDENVLEQEQNDKDKDV